MQVYRKVDEDFPSHMLTVLRGLPVDDPDKLEQEIEAFKKEHGYVTHDVVTATPEVPEEAFAKFDKPHTHSEDEIRLFVDGSGIFDLRDDDGTWFRFILEKGDMIVVPAGRVHRFEPTWHRRFKAVRIFQDEAGWVPHYVD